MSKKIDSNAMGRLLEGLTSGRTPAESGSMETQQAMDIAPRGVENGTMRHPISKVGAKERICTSIDKTVMNKIRTISEKENVQINELISFALEMFIGKYEGIHGQVRPKRNVRGDINRILQ